MFELILHLLRSPFRSRQALILENVALRHQLQVLGRSHKRLKLRNRDRTVWILLGRFWNDWRSPLVLVQPETVIRWHRQGLRAFWRRKSQRRGPGRPRLDRSERDLIRQMAHDNPTWGAPRIHGDEIVSVDFFTVPTITCQVLYVFLLIHNASRRIVHFNFTAHPTMEWTARQLVEAFPWDTAPTYVLRDNDAIYGEVFRRQLEILDIRDVPTAPRSPWQNPYVERLIGTERRECLDHVIVLGDRHLSRVLRSYVEYYNGSRTHLGLAKDCPVPRAMERPEVGPIRHRPMVGGLHHHYYRKVA